MSGRDLLEVSDLDPFDVIQVLDNAEVRDPAQVLSGRGVALLFEKPSVRTRNATEMAVMQLGGHPVSMRSEEVGLSAGRETPADVARTLACYHAAVGARVFDHAVLEQMAEAIREDGMDCPVMNLLSDSAHPCQALADLLTIRQLAGGLHGIDIAYIGDANNVCRSLASACALMGLNLRVSSPEGYGLTGKDLSRYEEIASSSGHGGSVKQVRDPRDAVGGATFVYADVWTSMGLESEAKARSDAFRGYTVDAFLMSHATDGAHFLHCLPAHRGEEVSAEVIDGPASRVWQQAENRMHVMRGLLLWMFS